MMKFIAELANEYTCGFYVERVSNGRLRLWTSGLYCGEFDTYDEIRAWCAENLKRREKDHEE